MKLKPFGLTGNIGCGKSTVATLLSEHPDVLILNCDLIAKEIISGKADGADDAAHIERRQRINTILGADVFPQGRADFQAIAVIFKEPDKKKALEEFIHPLVWEAVDEKVASAIADNAGTICVVESAIIFEIGAEDKFAAVIAAICNPQEQFRRLRKDRQMTDEQIQARVNLQLPSAEKESRSQFAIHTDCSMEELKGRVSDLYHNLKQQKESIS